jgi:leucyl-tRNA---protein transferase
MSEHQKQFPEFFVTNPSPCPYLPGRMERKLFTHLTHDKPPEVIDKLLTNGFRRSQNVAYLPYCQSCQSCISVRVVVGEFEVGRNMRRIEARNRDLVTRHLPALPTAEQYRLFQSYIDKRHPDGGMSGMNVLDYALMVEDTIVDTTVVEYRLPPAASTRTAKPSDTFMGGKTGGPLVAVALQDRVSDGISMVYSFFDPELTERSLGTYLILDAIRQTQILGLPYLYLGFWIQRSEKMNYKARFTPQDMLTGEGWIRRPA